MDPVYIKSIALEGIHQRYNLNIDFHETLNVLHGQNGTGKSTLIHIIANIVNNDFLRFIYLDFITVRVVYSDGNFIQIIKDGEEAAVYTISSKLSMELKFNKVEALETLNGLDDDRLRRDFISELMLRQKNFIEASGLPKIKSSYFPAFRTMLEAWSSQEEDGRLYGRTRTTPRVTSFARNLFGRFLPAISYPSPLDIENNLREEIRDAQLKIGRYESSIFSQSFVRVFSAILSGAEGDAGVAEKLLEEISDLTNESAISIMNDFQGPSYAYAELQRLIGSSRESQKLASSASGALTVYRDALLERKQFQSEIFAKINKYFDAVNAFLDQKELRYEPDSHRRVPKVGLKFPDGSWSSVKVMSSGERQLLTMLYAVTKMSSDSLVLIDEPELSLHIDWQEELLGKMMEQLGARQIIVCTHSPSIAADYDKYMIEVAPIYTERHGPRVVVSDDDEELI
ncbi:AAA family ATPase [Pseudomonas lijiangensis]|uniref:AAA family ATPase n=1 Tax=Pseudomonas syringae group TaxID=136849 RepID=UPI00190FF1C1|nr:AAA family ATPase [Pseudomonas cichorii]GFM66958.1 ATP-binding protein [Pseudomonas cichorii]